MKVTAAICWEPRRPLAIDEIDLEGPKAGECLIRLAATGVCHTDAYTMSGRDPSGLFPTVLGHEGAGVVEEVGPGVSSLAVLSAGASPGLVVPILDARHGEWFAAAYRVEANRPPVPVLDDDSVETLSARILAEEHRAYPEAMTILLDEPWTIEGRRFLRLRRVDEASRAPLPAGN